MNDHHLPTFDRAGRELDREITAALASLLASAPAAEPAAPERSAQFASGRPSNRSRVALGVAASVAVAGVGGLLVVRGDSDDSETNRADAPVTAPVSEPSASVVELPVSTIDGTSNRLVPGIGDPVGLYLPTYLPDGYQISSLSANEPENPLDRTEFVRFDPDDGSVVASFGVRFTDPVGLERMDFDPDTPVRGMPAEVHHVPARSPSELEEVHALWVEADMVVDVDSYGLSEADTIAVAEALVIDAAQRTVQLPPDSGVDLRAVDDFDLVPDNAVESGIGLSRFDGQPGSFVSAGVDPNDLGQSIESIVESLNNDGSGSAWEPRVVGDRQVYVQQRPTDQYGPFTNVVWLDGPFQISVSGRAAPDQVLAFAAGLEPVDAEAFAAAGHKITTRALVLPVLDRVTFSDGVVVSVRSAQPGPEGSGASALCVEAPVEHCRFNISETSIGGEFQNLAYDTFDLGPRVVMIGWQDTEESARTGEPTLVANGDEPVPAATNARIVEQTMTDLGRFIEIELAPDEAPPHVRYEIDGTIQFDISAASQTDGTSF